MSFPTPNSHPSPPKRPRLSLQIKTPSAPQTLGKSATALKTDIDPSSPTAFNTLSNAYAAAIEAASPRTAIPTSSISSQRRGTSLRLETSTPTNCTQKPAPAASFAVSYPNSPNAPSTISNQTPFTYTPPQSALPKDSPNYTFTSNTSRSSPLSPLITRRRATVGSHALTAPYAHPNTLHSILRNSPLPPNSSAPISPTSTRKSPPCRSKRVAYLDPLTQTITTNKYVKSHIELLAEEASPVPDECIDPLDLEDDVTRDGGMTPGPFEEMRRRMAGLGGKKAKREKKRKWVWTIGDAEDMEEEERPTPVTAVFCGDEREDVVMRN